MDEQNCKVDLLWNVMDSRAIDADNDYLIVPGDRKL